MSSLCVHPFPDYSVGCSNKPTILNGPSLRPFFPLRTHLSLPRSRHHRFVSFHCWASAIDVSLVEDREEKGKYDSRTTFDAEGAASLLRDLRESFNSGKTRPYQWRVSQLQGISDMIDNEEEQIFDALHKDLAKPKFEAFVSELSLTKSSCKLALQEVKGWMEPQKVQTAITTFPSSAEIVSEPLGVVLVISSWNFPFLLSLEPVIGAIAAGNAVVLKPSEVAPASSSLLAKLLKKYLDTSAIRVVEGAIDETTTLLGQKWDKIFYTGSSAVGRIVMAAAAKHLTPVTLELGGKCPVVVDSDIDLKITAKRIIAGKWGANNGQACIGADYIITTESFASKLIKALKHELDECFGKNHMESKDISRIVSTHHFKRLIRLLDEEKVLDKVVLGGQRDEEKLRIAPTILLDVPEDSFIMKEEIFGPLLPILTVKNLNQSFNLIKSRPKPLVAYLFTNSNQLQKDFVKNISAGGMVINDTILHVTEPTLPFGGVGESGMGSYHGKFSFDAFSHKKAVLYRSFKGDSSVRYPPYASTKLKMLKALASGNMVSLVLALLGGSKD